MRALIITSLILAACGDDTTTKQPHAETNNGTSNAELVEQCEKHCTQPSNRSAYCPFSNHSQEFRQELEDRCPGYTYQCPRELREIAHEDEDGVYRTDDTCRGFCESNNCVDLLFP